MLYRTGYVTEQAWSSTCAASGWCRSPGAGIRPIERALAATEQVLDVPIRAAWRAACTLPVHPA
jgi:hypothetical protein